MRSQKVPPRTVLLVSHDRSLKRQLQDCLAAIGLPATLLLSVHKNTEQPLPSAKAPPHMILLDDSVLAQGGPTVLERLYQSAPRALFVYIASHHTAELERVVRQLGVLYYTAKPPEDFLLQRVLASALQRSRGEEKFAA